MTGVATMENLAKKIPLVILLPGGNLAIRSAVNDQQDYQYNGKMRLTEGKWYDFIVEQVLIDNKVG